MATTMKMHHGTPTPHIDGKPVFASYLWGHSPSVDGYASAPAARHYAAAGIHLHAFDVGVGREWCGPGEGRAGHYDFSEVERRLGHILKVDPEARFHLRFGLEISPREHWWHNLYPQEREIDSSGKPTTQSFASTVWRQQTKDFLTRYAEHLKDIGLAERVFAYQTGAGHTGEWVKGLTSMRTPCGDYLEPMQQHFRAWLEARYGDEEALREAWHDGRIRFRDAAVPSPQAQWETQHWTFRDPRREQAVIDYYHCLADLCGDLVIDFNRAIKEVTGDLSLTGAFFGYLFELAWNAGFFSEGPDSPYSTYQRSGHLGLARILESEYVDFIVSPFSYGFRGLGGHGPAMPPSESPRLHNVIYLYEDDARTYLGGPLIGFGRARSLEDSIAILKRNFSEVVTRAQGIWWNAGPSHIDPVAEPAFRPLLKQFQEIGTFALELERAPSAEIAVLLDDESFYYEWINNDLDLPLIFQQRLWGLPRLGAPADYYLLNDFLAGRLPPYKLYILLNPWHLDDGRRAALAEQLHRDGRVALWIYAPGYIKDEPSLAHMQELTGFRFGKGEHMWGPMVHILDFEHPITASLPEDFCWGTNARLGPVFHLEDDAARVLGQVVYSQGRCLPGFGVKELDTWRSVYAAAPNLPAPVLRGLARYAGVHLYSEAGDVLYACPQLLAVHTVGGGRRELRLPRRVEVVFDLFAGKEVASKCDAFTIDLPKRSTALWYTGERALLGKLPR
ncbi:MAG: hypothetical protein ABIL09_07005 [Gemmatimonadota bacterium]